MNKQTVLIVTAILTVLPVWIIAATSAWAVPNLTPGSKRYCACTCATKDSVLFEPTWEKRYDCSLANNKKCTREKDGATGRLHSCMECEKSGGVLHCVHPDLAAPPSRIPPGMRVPPGKLEQIVPRGIDGTQEIEPPTLEPEEKGK